MELIMSKCIRCHVEVLDDSIICPLCQGVLKKDVTEKKIKYESSKLEAEKALKETEEKEDTKKAKKEKAKKEKAEDVQEPVSRSASYPNVIASTHRMQFVMRIVFFAAVLAETVCILVNKLTFKNIWWSAIVGVGLLFGYLTLYILFHNKKSLQKTILIEMILAVIASVGIDEMLGFTGWSFTYAIPITMISVDVAALVLMIVNIENWQTFIMSEIVTLLFSVALLVLGLNHVVPFGIMTYISIFVCGFIFLGTITFGEKMVVREIERRFRI